MRELRVHEPGDTGVERTAEHANPAIPQPEILGRNRTYVVFRKLHQRVATFRQYLSASASDPAEEELIAAKMMDRWRSGAPLARCPFHERPGLDVRVGGLP
jgi:hypothetical protein